MDVFVARQPIFDRKQRVVAYELLFRNNQNNYYDNVNADEATIDVILNGFLVIGMENLTSGKRAFINFTESLLVSDIITKLPKGRIVVEILEDVEVTDEIINTCKKLKSMGYILALDDFVFEPKYEPLIKLVDIIKVDFKLTTGDQRRELIENINSPNIKFLAEKVETMEEYQNAVRYGYTYFQGYFFSKPIIMKAKELPIYNNSYFLLMDAVTKQDIDFNEIEEIIKRDVSLSYKLLKFINSACFSFKSKVDSIKHALVMLGKDEVIKWIYLVILKDFGDKKPDELMRTSVVRAKFGETIAASADVKIKESDCFLMGMLSLIDIITNVNMEFVLKQMPISEEIKHALLGGDNEYRDVFELITAYEKAQWNKFDTYSRKISFNGANAPKLYLEALAWADDFMLV